MSEDRQTQLTHVLRDLSEGKERADQLLPIVYEELRSLVRAKIAKEAPGQTLQATALVHEAFLRLVGNADPGWNGRAHFFGAASLAIRRILVEQARRKARVRHGGGRHREALDDVELVQAPPRLDVLAVDEAVRRLEREDRRKGQVVNLRYFSGLTAPETAAVLGVSVGTVEREWRFIKAWLQTELAEQRESDPKTA